MREIMMYLFPLIIVAFMVWAIANAIRTQKKSAARLQGLLQNNDQKFGDALEVSKRQLAVSEQMLEELRSIRRQLEHKDKSARQTERSRTRATDNLRGFVPSVSEPQRRDEAPRTKVPRTSSARSSVFWLSRMDRKNHAL